MPLRSCFAMVFNFRLAILSSELAKYSQFIMVGDYNFFLNVSTLGCYTLFGIVFIMELITSDKIVIYVECFSLWVVREDRNMISGHFSSTQNVIMMLFTWCKKSLDQNLLWHCAFCIHFVSNCFWDLQLVALKDTHIICRFSRKYLCFFPSRVTL